MTVVVAARARARVALALRASLLLGFVMTLAATLSTSTSPVCALTLRRGGSEEAESKVLSAFRAASVDDEVDAPAASAAAASSADEVNNAQDAQLEQQQQVQLSDLTQDPMRPILQSVEYHPGWHVEYLAGGSGDSGSGAPSLDDKHRARVIQSPWGHPLKLRVEVRSRSTDGGGGVNANAAGVGAGAQQQGLGLGGQGPLASSFQLQLPPHVLAALGAQVDDGDAADAEPEVADPDGTDISVHVWDLSAGRAPGLTEEFEGGAFIQDYNHNSADQALVNALPIGVDGAPVRSIELSREEHPELFRRLAVVAARPIGQSDFMRAQYKEREMGKLLLPKTEEINVPLRSGEGMTTAENSETENLESENSESAQRIQKQQQQGLYSVPLPSLGGYSLGSFFDGVTHRGSSTKAPKICRGGCEFSDRQQVDPATGERVGVTTFVWTMLVPAWRDGRLAQQNWEWRALSKQMRKEVAMVAGLSEAEAADNVMIQSSLERLKSIREQPLSEIMATYRSLQEEPGLTRVLGVA